jgi:hypothetical protein
MSRREGTALRAIRARRRNYPRRRIRSGPRPSGRVSGSPEWLTSWGTFISAMAAACGLVVSGIAPYAAWQTVQDGRENELDKVPLYLRHPWQRSPSGLFEAQAEAANEIMAAPGTRAPLDVIGKGGGEIKPAQRCEER